MNMHDHEGWRVGVTPFQVDEYWSARIELWQPGAGPRTHVGLPLAFHGAYDDAAKAESAAVDRAKSWISQQGNARQASKPDHAVRTSWPRGGPAS